MRPIIDVPGFTDHPVKGASSFFAILFTISCILHIWQNCTYRCWGNAWLLPCASLIFTAGFICREYTAFHPTVDTSSQGLLNSAVPIITLPLYIFLARLLATHTWFAPIRYAHLCCIIAIGFTCAIIPLVSHATSSFFSATASPKSIRAGLALLKASLILQLFLNVAFLVVVSIFHCRCLSAGMFHQTKGRGVKIVIITFYISATCVLVRNLFRTVQIFSPSNSPAWVVEAYFWVFDATPMLAYSGTLNILHPAKYLRTEGSCCKRSSATERVDDPEVER